MVIFDEPRPVRAEPLRQERKRHLDAAPDSPTATVLNEHSHKRHIRTVVLAVCAIFLADDHAGATAEVKIVMRPCPAAPDVHHTPRAQSIPQSSRDALNPDLVKLVSSGYV